MRQHWLTHPEATMTPIALPQAIVRALRDPVPDAKDFTPTKFQPAASKALFVGHCVKFISADFPRHQFTRRFYGQLIHCFAFIAMYDQDGFWTEYFTTNAGKIEFLQQMLSHPCYGDPCHTFSDAEREIIKRLRRTDVLSFYRQRLSVEQDATDRAELARLLTKYGQDTPAVDPGILRTVLLPMNRLDTARTVRRRDDNGQLALGFG